MSYSPILIDFETCPALVHWPFANAPAPHTGVLRSGMRFDKQLRESYFILLEFIIQVA